MTHGSQWVTVQEIAAPGKWSLNGGPFGSKLVSKDYVTEGVPVIRGANLPFDSRFSQEEFVFVSPEKAQSLIAHSAKRGDVVFTQRGTLGQVGLIPDDSKHGLYIISQSQMKLTVDETKADPEWIYYYFRQPAVIEQLIGLQSSSGVPHINLATLREYRLPLPPLPTQRKIAAILSAYDDLIENNTRRVRVLEQMARALYREWFVEYRYPGHEQAQWVEDEAGRRPQGWEWVTVGDVALVHRGRSYKKENLVETGGMPFINLKCIERDGGFRMDGIKRYEGPIKPTQTVVADDIVMGVTDMTQERRIVARAARIPRLEAPAAVSMDVVKIQPREDISNSYLYGMFRFSDFADEVKLHANGANVLHLNPERITAFEFALPNEDLRNQYGQFASAIYSQIDVLNLRNANLRRTRDLLLPRLVSGELDVSGLRVAGIEEEFDAVEREAGQ
ncbi:restriction endonuclease subunit S [Deinococcus sp. SL84]|uniref:restriction endonuclease subunit S n=1 Tax=Deinococcus sp. SL84 TaxID=2994663 RepID=UPI00227450F8|nr:restriction endonuclease subunit S [Deinococcus sp. SL84]MCY1702750.1 restriction endonuclease subunit S [Deinococcus sp. SL84]